MGSPPLASDPEVPTPTRALQEGNFGQEPGRGHWKREGDWEVGPAVSPVLQSLRSYNVLYCPSSSAHPLQATRRRTGSGCHLLSIYRIEVKCYAKHFIDTLSRLTKSVCLRSGHLGARLGGATHSCHFLADAFPFHGLWPGGEEGRERGMTEVGPP